MFYFAYFPHTEIFPQNLASVITASQESAPKLDSSFINALRHFCTAAYKTFLQTATFQKTTPLVPKLLVYPIRQEI